MPIHATREGLKREGRANKLGTLKPLKAIRLKCLECSGGQPGEVRDCQITICPLWPYRSGHSPQRAGVGGNPQLTGRKRQQQEEPE